MIDLALNLSTQREYLSSLALIRQRITLGRDRGNLPTALRLAVRLPYGEVEVFLLTSNLYLIGFRGRSKVYALTDETNSFSKAISDSGRLNAKESVVTLGQAGDHAALGTFTRGFDYTDLSNCSVLSMYSDGEPYAMIRRPLALLVCMLCEGTRFLQVQNAFAGVDRERGQYWARPVFAGGVWGSSVDASEIVNYWSNATRARAVAERHGLGVTEGHKRALEFKAGIAQLENTLGPKGAPFTRAMLYSWVAGRQQPSLTPYESLPGVADTLNKLRKTAQALGLTSGDAVSQFLTALQNEIAVEAARGLLLPSI